MQGGDQSGRVSVSIRRVRGYGDFRADRWGELVVLLVRWWWFSASGAAAKAQLKSVPGRRAQALRFHAQARPWASTLWPGSRYHGEENGCKNANDVANVARHKL